MKYSRKYKERMKNIAIRGITSVMAIVLVAIIVCTCFADKKQVDTELYAQAPKTEIKESVASETGFQQDLESSATYYIYDLDGLCEFRNKVNSGNAFSGKSIYLMNNIDLSSIDNWTPIGDYNHKFSGRFYGNFHVIKNLKISKTYAGMSTTRDYYGLFGNCGFYGGSSAISNLIVKDCDIYIKVTSTANSICVRLYCWTNK